MRAKLCSIANHSVSKNALALIFLQAANSLIPLLVIPFLTRALGLETFGLVAIALALIQLAYVVTDYGFSLSASFSISQIREDKKTVSELIGAVFILKIGLSVIASIFVLLYGLIGSSDMGVSLIYYVAPIAILGQAFQPVWFFQGIEKMKNVTIYMVIVRSLYAVFVVLLVSVPDDAWIVILVWGLSHVVGAILAIWRVYTEGYTILLPDRSKLLSVFRESSQFFASRVAVSLYTSASTVVVGIAGGVVSAAQYSVCEQLYKGGQSLTAPLNQALYPYMAKNRDLSLFYKVLMVVGSLILLGCFSLSFFSADILVVFFGEEYREASVVLMVFLAVNVVNFFGVSFGYPAHAATGDVSFANTSVVFGAVLHILLLFTIFILDDISAVSVAVAVLITESMVMTTRMYHVMCSGRWSHQGKV
jgi:PST family polysaccharide transporter